ncbi:MAG: PBP1A family penicillin-binding protein [Proteobacteria bacterium]|nr:PBP1A family penicillin-binding protein [Pelagibacterales bacterium]MDA1181517.1 PBP1A family penicillin-binding protein [Pseudomonadota bacterium]
MISLLFFSLLWKYTPELPSYSKILQYKPELSSRLYSSDGVLLKSYHREERIFIPIERIPKQLINAFLSSEDKNFYSHFGIDFIAIIRAAISNIFATFNNQRLIGASTITQQVVKNLLLSNEVSFDRKIKEILLSIRIENILSKNQILELYLNDIYLGFKSYGIAAASLNYFNKSISELDLSEIAFLASLPKAPNNYNPKKNYAKAFARKNWVIDRMYENGFIQYDDLNFKNKPIQLIARDNRSFIGGNYFYEEIRKKLFLNYGTETLYSEGLIIKTSLNSDLQYLAEESLINGLIKYDKNQGWRGVIGNLKDYDGEFKDVIKKIKNPFPNKWFLTKIEKVSLDKLFVSSNNLKNIEVDLNLKTNQWLVNQKFEKNDLLFIEKNNLSYVVRQIPNVNGAIIVIDPFSGDVLAMSGGFSFQLSQFNRSIQAMRQPGSAFKPFVYISALNKGYTPSTLILDAPYVIDQGPGLPKWKPANYSDEFYGLTTMRTGIEKSRNLMTIRLANKIGINTILSTARDFKIAKYLDKNMSMSLGSGLVTLIDLVNAYGIIANGGREIKPNIIKSIYSRKGIKILDNSNKFCNNCKLETINNNSKLPEINNTAKEVIDPKIAYQITSMMEGVIQRGTARSLRDLKIPLAGKTGTTNDNKDAWFIGYSPDLVVGVFVGHDTPKNLGYKQTGSSVAVPIFKDFIIKSNTNENNIPFKVPSGLSFVKINNKTGLPSNDKESIMEAFIEGSEPYTQDDISILDSLGIISNSISGTGALLTN